MKKLLSAVILHVLLLPSLTAQSRLFDQGVQLKTCNISIEANQFVAKTFIEMEFYNPKDTEVEGYQSFTLNKGQVVTDFQLELNGKYRDASIEEKWKAIRAYSSIVGKRVDPAILQMSYNNYYNIHIYPVPAHGSRKVTMTIHQLMVEDSGRLNYYMPLNFTSNTESFNLKIRVDNGSVMPECNHGLLDTGYFILGDRNAELNLGLKNTILARPVSFSLPLKNSSPQLCITNEDGVGKFLIRFSPTMVKYYDVQPHSISVFWDVSSSSGSRNIKKEIDFLEQYILLNKITSTTVTLFNQDIRQTVAMDSRTKDFNVLRSYLANYSYSGATTFGNLDFSSVKADAVLLFSDGFNSFGKSTPKPATVQVNCIVSSPVFGEQQLRNIIGSTGGALIDLFKTPVSGAVKLISSATNFLMKYNSKNSSVYMNEKFPLPLQDNILLSGTFSTDDHLRLIYGNTGSVNKIEEIYLSITDTCSRDVYDKVRMLKSYDSVMAHGNWDDMVIFGLKENVVTPRTSMIVLEKTEDYIKYNIAPPKELEEECAQRGYVYKSEYKIRALKLFTEQDILQNAVNIYNRYLTWWSINEAPVDLNKTILPAETDVVQAPSGNKEIAGTATVVMNNQPGEVTSNTIKEVIVTSAFQVKRSARSQSTNVQVVYAEQLTTANNYDLNNALAGKVAGIQVRSQSSVLLGKPSSIRLRGENGLTAGTGPIYVVNGTIINDPNEISINDIEYITVLQAVQANALFGSEGANGAILIEMKKGRRYYYGYPGWKEYKLKNIEEEDYVKEMQNCELDDMMTVYTNLERVNKNSAVFYFDMADCFFERKQQEKAVDILFEGIELCKGSSAGLKAAAYIFESWKDYVKAINIYESLLEKFPGDLITKRDLALAYFQNGDYQKAVNVYYEIISASVADNDYDNNSAIKVMAINEMNAIISMHGSCIHTGSMNMNLVKLLPVDLHITIESNDGYLNNVRLVDDSGTECSYPRQFTNNGRIVNRGYRYYYNYISDYSIKAAMNGTYKVKVDSYNNYTGGVPVYLRLVVFKNFQKPNQTMEVQYIVMNNQYGSVEVAEIKW